MAPQHQSSSCAEVTAVVVREVSMIEISYNHSYKYMIDDMVPYLVHVQIDFAS